MTTETFIKHEPPTIEERYGLAVGSKNLKMGRLTDAAQGRGPIDLVVAVGWLGDSLGALLIRLHGEFDSAIGDIRLSRENLRASQAIATAEESRERLTKVPCILRPDILRQRATDRAVSDFLLIRSKLKTLQEVEDKFAGFAEAQAVRRRSVVPPAVVRILAARALEAHLDPLCPRCNGTGTYGGYDGTVQNVCRSCGGSKLRKMHMGRDVEESNLAGHLLVCLSQALERARVGMGRAMQ